MMSSKQKNIDFSTPTRQSYVAIILIIYKIYKRFFRAFWVVLLPLVLGRKENSQIYISVFIGISILLVIYGIIDFFRYKFYLKSDEFIVEKGVFSKKRIVIPFNRIQTINFKQNIVQQVFSVVGLELDTAGTAKKEFDFDALDVPTSNALRDYIFAHKTTSNITNLEDAEFHESVASQSKLIFSLKMSDLLKIGVTQNHFRSLFFALFSLYWLLDQIEKAGFDTSIIEDVTEENIVQLGIYILVSLFIFAFVLIIIVSIIRTILKYFNFVMKRIPNGFKLEYGLFNRNEISVMDNKVQVLIWADNLLRRTLGLFSLQIKLASSVSVKQKSSIIIPGLLGEDIRNIKEYYFNNESSNITVFQYADIYYLYRRWGIVSLLFIIGEVLGFYFFDVYTMGFVFLFSSYFYVTSYLKYRKMKFGFNNEVLNIQNGIFGNRTTLLYLYKLQGVCVKQSPVQSRKNLADIVVYTAAGAQRIKYISYEKAKLLRDYILYRIESERREWM